MPLTLTAANSVLMLSVIGLFSTPQQIQGFATDDAFDFEDRENAETRMGVDGRLSAGYKAAPQPQTITLQADSPSMSFFDTVISQEDLNREKFWFLGSLNIPGVNTKWTMTNGVLSRFTPAPAAKAVLEPRKFTITWERALPQPTA